MDFTGTWLNQNGSILTIVEQNGNDVTGTFLSKKGRAAEDQEFPVVGKSNGELLALIVDFANESTNLHATVTFSGRRGEDGNIHTMWILARQFEDSEQTKASQVWNTFMVNSDVFHPTTP